jgi:hypothetical protein
MMMNKTQQRLALIKNSLEQRDFEMAKPRDKSGGN